MEFRLQKAIFWDNDGVLIDSEEIFFDANRAVLGRAGIMLDRDTFIDISLHRGLGVIDAMAATLSPASRAALRRERDDLYARLLAGIPARPGIADCLAALHGRSLMAVVTASQRRHFDIIHTSTGFAKYFNFVVTAEDVRRPKPDPDGYRRAVERAGVPAEHCLVVEDSERGLAAAKAAGLACVALPSALTRGSAFAGAHRVAASAAELRRILDNWVA